ncbi:MAG: hypothetical protein JNK25_05090 [Phycisphaerae bacterium]|nr:hypothetical protein [Phycisphaerae bacterium]
MNTFSHPLLFAATLSLNATAQVHYRAADFGQPRATYHLEGPQGIIDQSRAPVPLGIGLGDVVVLGNRTIFDRDLLSAHETVGTTAEPHWAVLDRINPQGVDQRVFLPLPDADPLEFVLVQGEYRAPDDFTWYGQIAGVAFSDVILVRYKDSLRIVARDYNPGRPYIEVRYSPLGVHLVTATDRNYNDECIGIREPRPELPPADPLPADPPPGGGGYGERASTDPTTRIDMMVVPTQNSRNAYGTENAFLADCLAMMADTNLRASASGAPWSVRLVASGWAYGANYFDSGNIDNELNRISNGSDGFLDGATNSRPDTRPDVIAVIVEGGGAGVGWRPATTGQLNIGAGFFVSSRSAAVANGTFAHELGHNLGGCHNSEQGGCTSALNSTPRGIARFCDANIFYDDIEYRTTMSYQVNTTVTSTRIQRYSVNGLQVVRTGTFGEELCRLDMWDSVSQAVTTFNVARPFVTQYNIHATQMWASPGAGGDGTHLSPFGRVANAVAAVKGGVGAAVVRARAGTFQETSGPAVVLSNPSLIRAEGGTVLLR